MRKGNIHSGIPEMLPEELFEVIGGSERVRIERIVSQGHASPEGFWYDQGESEWVMVLQGSACLRFEEKERLVVLGPGDWVDIPAHVRHKVEWTDSNQKTVWLAVFY
ncbi:MAG: cupin domain-containing protein [Syntrophobacteraceae bacterium]